MQHYVNILEAAKAAGACSGPVAALKAAIAAKDLAAADKVVSDNFGWCIGKILHALESGRSYAGRKIEFTLDENGHLHGECKWYNSDGSLSEHGYYSHGKRHGECKWYNSNGKLWMHVHYSHGKRHGECKWYNSNGSLSEHGYYENGRLVETIL